MGRQWICIDFDGTIREDSPYMPGSIFGDPLPGARFALAELADKYNVAIFTTRVSPHWGDRPAEQNRRAVESWLLRNSLIKGEHWHDIIGHKIPAQFYIDDRAIAFHNWEEALQAAQTWKEF